MGTLLDILWPFVAVSLWDGLFFAAVCSGPLALLLLGAAVEVPLDWLRERVRGRWAWLERMDP